MTQEEIIRFALMLREADKVQVMIAEDEAAEIFEELALQDFALEVAT